MRKTERLRPAAFLIVALLVAGCIAEEETRNPQADSGADANAQATAQANAAAAAERARARQEVGDVRFLVDLSERRLQVMRGSQMVGSHEVAVGSAEWPTPTGRFSFDRVDINPDWTPPDSEWAEEREPKQPGEEGNPMGRARLVYDRDYTIHGTEEIESLGADESHGSIRVANEDVLALAELLLKAGGAWEGKSWFADMAAQPTRMFSIDLQEPVAIEIVD